jgi:hypothetical protein
MAETPTLLDRMVWAARGLPGFVVPTSAMRFVFDAEASAHLARIDNAIGHLIGGMLDFARPPAGDVWIELDWRAFCGALEHSSPVDATTPAQLGWGINRGLACTMTYTPGAPGNGLEPSLPYLLDRPNTFAEEIKIAEALHTSRGQFDMMYWGSAFTKVSPAETSALRDRYGVALETMVAWGRPSWNAAEFYGGLRHVIVALLALSRPANVRYLDVSARKGFTKGKLRQFLSHNRVRLEIDRPLEIVRVPPPDPSCQDGLHYRLHEVRSHWCETRKLRNTMCTHEFAPDAKHPRTDDQGRPARFVCKNCGTLRWWRKPHARGDAGIGVVTKEYAVTTSKQ